MKASVNHYFKDIFYINYCQIFSFLAFKTQENDVFRQGFSKFNQKVKKRAKMSKNTYQKAPLESFVSARQGL